MMQCPKCNSEIPAGSIFCNRCGCKLNVSSAKHEEATKNTGARKYATILFSDLSGYTAMTEKLDPEDVKNLMEDIFDQIGKIVEKYEGTVDSFFGDEILILYGVPKVHEDDPVRAIRTAIEINELIETISGEFERKYQIPLQIHSGINSGLVVTGDKFIGKGRQGLAGDAVNLASRLTGMAKPGQIIVGEETYKIAKNYFLFENRDPVAVKGKQEPVKSFQVVDVIKKIERTKRLHGVRSDLIGRTRELFELGDAVKDLKSGKGSVFYVVGAAGSGKSRLLQEFKATTRIRWIEGYTYPYTQNNPYFPIITLFDEALKIDAKDSSETLRLKLEKNIERLIPNSQDIIPYIGSLYSLDYPEIDGVSPEFLKSKLFDAVYKVLIALAGEQPTIICVEDLHWSDPSSLELIRFIQDQMDAPVMFIYVTRPTIRLFSNSFVNQMKLPYHELAINDLSAPDSKMMVHSLLDTKQIPEALEHFVENRTQGNPFYLEEMVNSLIESNVLVQKGDQWKLQRSITETDISSSIHSVVAARVDRLEKDVRLVLQEASVIGRSFYYQIIQQISDTKKEIHTALETLEGLDFIKSREANIDLEYIFKHALTQEVVYKGLLKTQRRNIHERIGTVIEKIFSDRLPEFYETLAHHFLKGKSTPKALDYLIKSGDKSIRKYSLDEAHDYFQKAFDLIDATPDKDSRVNELMIDLLTRWALVFYYRGTFKDLRELLFSQEYLLESMADSEIKGMFLAWQGFVLEFLGDYQTAERYLEKAVDIGRRINNHRILGYALTWLSNVSGDLGHYQKGIELGQEGHRIGTTVLHDHYVSFKSLGCVGINYYWMGYAHECIKIGDELIQYGDQYSQIRSLSYGHQIKCQGYVHFGDFKKAVASAEQAVKTAVDPYYSNAFHIMLIYASILNRDMKQAETYIKNVRSYFIQNEERWMGDICFLLDIITQISNGQMSSGFKKLIELLKTFRHQKRVSMECLTLLTIGKVYLEMIQGNASISFSTLIKNLGFIIKHVPTAYKKAEYWFTKTIELAEETGAIGIKAQAHLDLGIIHKIKKQDAKAKSHFENAIVIFEEIGAYAYLKQAKKELEDQ
jgi:class 3 adenylate cyclase/tetratricopeptide (TPR) repeat protein